MTRGVLSVTLGSEDKSCVKPSDVTAAIVHDGFTQTAVTYNSMGRMKRKSKPSHLCAVTAKYKRKFFLKINF